MRALLVIDMLRDFIYKDCVLPVNGAKKLIPPINYKIIEFREINEPIIFICDSHDEMDEEFDVWGKHAVEGTEGAEIIDELDRREYDIVVTKKRFSAFYNTDLERILKGLNVDTLVITGVVTDICILHTAADATMRGFKVIVPENCVATVDEEKQKWALRHIKEVLDGRID